MNVGAIPAFSSRALDQGTTGMARSKDLDAQSQEQVRELKRIDRQVRAHERAHLSAAAGLAVGGANFQTVRGPDGRSYAVGGEVSIDVSPARDPEQTIAKAKRIQAAALAPADPSSQDRAVAAAAMQMQLRAQAELNRARQDERQADNGTASSQSPLTAYSELEPAPESLLSLFA
jgi:hypothetical protein